MAFSVTYDGDSTWLLRKTLEALVGDERAAWLVQVDVQDENDRPESLEGHVVSVDTDFDTFTLAETDVRTYSPLWGGKQTVVQFYDVVALRIP